MQIAPSVLSADFSELGNELRRMEAAGADWIHLDVMDGSFVNNLTFGAPVIRCLRKCTSVPFDIHMMVQRPGKFLDDFISAGANLITIHYELESQTAVEDCLRRIKAAGCKAGLSIKPGTAASSIVEYIEKRLVDVVLVMTVEPGAGGQSLIQSALNKITVLREIQRRYEEEHDVELDIKYEVDGGINLETILLAGRKGFDIAVCGTAVFKSEDSMEAVRKLKAMGILGRQLSD